MIVVQLLKCMFRADLVIRTLLSKFRVIGHKRLVLRRVGNARKGGSLGRGLVALLLEEIRRNCPGQDPNDSADARPNGAEIVVCGYPERESCAGEEAQANDCRLLALLLLHVIPPFRKASPDPEVSPIYGVRGHSGPVMCGPDGQLWGGRKAARGGPVHLANCPKNIDALEIFLAPCRCTRISL